MTSAKLSGSVVLSESGNNAVEQRSPSDPALLHRLLHLAHLGGAWYWTQDAQFRFTWLSHLDPPGIYMDGAISLGRCRWELSAAGYLSDAEWAEHLAILDARKPFRDFEYPWQDSEGSIRWLSTSGDPITDDQGRFQGYAGICRMIPAPARFKVRHAPHGVEDPWSSQTRIEDPLHDMEALSHLGSGILDRVAAQICVLDNDGTILITNAAWRELAATTGAHPSVTLEGANYFDICASVSGADAQTAHAVLTGLRAVARGALLEFKHEYACTTGSTVRWYELHASRLIVAGTARLVVAHHDVTHLMQRSLALQSALNVQETFVQDLLHRTRNNLQLLSSLLHFQSRRAKRSDDRSVLEDTHARLRSMILLHNRIHDSSSHASIEFGDYLHAAVNDLVQSYLGDESRVQCEIHADCGELPIRVAMPCALLLNELVSNALKHAFPPPRAGRIAVSATRQADQLVLIVDDDGAGMSADSSQAGSGLGLRLARRIVAQLQGQLAIDTLSGVRVTVSVPIPHEPSQSTPAR